MAGHPGPTRSEVAREMSTAGVLSMNEPNHILSRISMVLSLSMHIRVYYNVLRRPNMPNKKVVRRAKVGEGNDDIIINKNRKKNNKKYTATIS